MKATRHADKCGFTLIELLAGMTILMIMVLFLNRIFADSTAMWKMGNKRIESSTDGRAVVNYMAHELSLALVDNVLSMRLESNVTNTLGAMSDKLYFVCADQIAEHRSGERYRQVREVGYIIAPMKDTTEPQNQNIANRFRVVRTGIEKISVTNFDCYWNKKWWQTSIIRSGSGGFDVLAENIRAVEYWVYVMLPNGTIDYIADYDSTIHPLPVWIDICVEMLGEADAIRAASMIGTNQTDYADRMSRRYVGRVYLANHNGYVMAK